MSAGRHVKVLRRRLNHLEHRLTDGKYSDASLGYLKNEIAALEWALEQLEADHRQAVA